MEPKIKAIIATAFIAGGAAGLAVRPAEVLAVGKLYADASGVQWTVVRVTQPVIGKPELVMCIRAPLSDGAGWTDAKCSNPLPASPALAKELGALLPVAAKGVGF